MNLNDSETDSDSMGHQFEDALESYLREKNNTPHVHVKYDMY